MAHNHTREASVTYEASSSLHQQLLHLQSKQYITAKAKKQISRLAIDRIKGHQFFRLGSKLLRVGSSQMEKYKGSWEMGQSMHGSIVGLNSICLEQD